jgi:replicative DNA helicase
MIDFAENIDSLETMVWNFVLNPDNADSELKPKNHASLSREEIVTMILPNYFGTESRNETYKLALKFFKQYNKIPNRNELSSFLELNNYFIEESELSELYLFNLKDYSYDYLYKYVKSFVLLRNLNVTMFDMIAFLKTAAINPDNIDSITDKIRNDINGKLSVSFSNAGHGLNFLDPKSHIQIAKVGTPSGFDFINKTQGGGWNLKTLVVFQGRPKVGKSMVLGNCAARSFLAGNNTGLVTVELADRSYMKRIGSNILNINKDEYENINDETQMGMVVERIQELKDSGRDIGHLEIVEFPTGGATAIDIENYFLRLETKLNKKFKVIVVDYLNLLKPIKDQNGLYEKVKSICEELRGVAMRNDWCIISATQIRRDDVDNFDLGMDSVAESFGLVHTVDALYGLMRSPLEGRMKVKVIANRDNGYEESYKFYAMNKDYFRLEEEVGMNSEYYSDDDQANAIVDEVRAEMNEATQPQLNALNSALSTTPSTNNTTSASEMPDDDYDALFDSI